VHVCGEDIPICGSSLLPPVYKVHIHPCNCSSRELDRGLSRSVVGPVTMRGTCKEGRSHPTLFQGFFPRAVTDKTRFVDKLVMSKKNYSFKLKLLPHSNHVAGGFDIRFQLYIASILIPTSGLGFVLCASQFPFRSHRKSKGKKDSINFRDNASSFSSGTPSPFFSGQVFVLALGPMWSRLVEINRSQL
jgi:hypothetical protein